MRLLYIEDEECIRLPVIRALRRAFFEHFDVTVSSTAIEAIAQLTKSTVHGSPFDFVLSDYNLLGVKTGGDVLAWVKEHASYLEHRFLFLSGSEEPRRLHGHWLPKPCSHTELVKTIKNMMACAA